MTLFRLEFPAVNSTPDEQRRANVQHSAALGLPLVLQLPRASGSLAICGGGPSLRRSLGILKGWEGDIWAINGTAAWLAEQGIPATFITVHSAEWPEDELRRLAPVKWAFVANDCPPALFDALAAADVRIFDWSKDCGEHGGTTTASMVPMLALRRGYSEVHYFGCEGSFDGTTHAYKNERGAWDVVIEAGGERYPTNCQMMLQSENLALLIREFPGVFHDQSGGLLRAMVRHPDTWGVADMNPALALEDVP